jgi:hypothetical protein
MSRFRIYLSEHKRSMILGLLFFLAVTLAFGIGYLVALEANPTPIVIEQCSQ